MQAPLRPQAILFDLDGTLADTAPDLAAAANRLRQEEGLPPAAYPILRAAASSGARGLIGAAFGITPSASGYENLRQRFLKHYETCLFVDSKLFDGVESLLKNLQALGIVWGIVTNKPKQYTEPLVRLLQLVQAAPSADNTLHARCVISGDTTAHAKPHPAPLLEAARCIQIPADRCWYIGDDLRDMQAGKTAGMVTVAAHWGYCDAAEAAAWPADFRLNKPQEIWELILACRIYIEAAAH